MWQRKKYAIKNSLNFEEKEKVRQTQTNLEKKKHLRQHLNLRINKCRTKSHTPERRTNKKRKTPKMQSHKNTQHDKSENPKTLISKQQKLFLDFNRAPPKKFRLFMVSYRFWQISIVFSRFSIDVYSFL